jgi:hypothetical protein
MNWYQLAVAVISGVVAWIAARSTVDNKGKSWNIGGGQSSHVPDRTSPTGYREVIAPGINIPGWADEAIATIVSIFVAWGSAKIGFSYQRDAWLNLINARIHTEAGRVAYLQDIQSDFYYIAFGATLLAALIAYKQERHIPWATIIRAPITYMLLVLGFMVYMANNVANNPLGIIGFFWSNLWVLVGFFLVFILFKGAKTIGGWIHDGEGLKDGWSTVVGGDGGKKKKAKETRSAWEFAVQKYDEAKSAADLTAAHLQVVKTKVSKIQDEMKDNRVTSEQLDLARETAEAAEQKVASQNRKVEGMEGQIGHGVTQQTYDKAVERLETMEAALQTARNKFATLKGREGLSNGAKTLLAPAEAELLEAEKANREAQAKADEHRRKAERAEAKAESAEHEANSAGKH